MKLADYFTGMSQGLQNARETTTDCRTFERKIRELQEEDYDCYASPEDGCHCPRCIFYSR